VFTQVCKTLYNKTVVLRRIPPQQIQGQRPPIEQSVHHADDDDDVAGTNDAAENNANIKRSNVSLCTKSE
jgi:hypothetical protein